MIAPPSFPFAHLAGEPPIKEGENGEAKRKGQGAECGTYRSGLMDFRPSDPASRENSESECLYTAEDMAQAVDDARRTAALEAEAAVRQAMANDIEQRRCDMLDAIKDQLERHQLAFEEELARLADVSQRLAVALAKAVIPQAIERQPLIDITDALKVALTRLATEPSIELRLPADLVEAGKTHLGDLAKEAGFTGDITTVADPALGDGDVELRWKGGAVDRRLDRLEAEVLGLVDHWLQEPLEAPVDEPVPPCQPLEPEIPNGLSDKTMDMRSANERVTS